VLQESQRWHVGQPPPRGGWALDRAPAGMRPGPGSSRPVRLCAVGLRDAGVERDPGDLLDPPPHEE
jgi:hypothetical protein